MTASAPAPLFAGKFRLLRLLGKGAMGEVWLADEEGPRNFRRRVALKRLLAAGDIDDYATESFVAEAQVIARLDHPNIVRLIELGSHEGAIYLVLDFIDGPSLDKIIKAGPLSAPAVAYVGREVARALEAVHTLSDDRGNNYGVVHRDVTPSNILLSRAGKVLLTDFGVARISGLGGDKTEAGVFKGKLPYMPPEQARGEPFDGRADLFSLAVTLFEALLGGRLRRAETQSQLILMVANEPLPRVRALLPQTPALLAMAVDRATSFEHDQRFEAARDLASHLDEALKSFGPGAEQRARDEIAERVASVAGPQLPGLAAQGPASSTLQEGQRKAEWSVPLGPAARPPIPGITPAPLPAPVTTSGQHLIADPPSQILDEPTNVVGSTGSGRTGMGTVARSVVPPERSRTALLIAVATAMLTLTLGAGALVILRRGPEARDTAPATSAVATSTAGAILSAAEPPPAFAEPIATADPAIAPSASAAPSAAPKPAGSSGNEPASGPGNLAIVVLPWGEVSVDGRSVGSTPIAPLSLPAGQHRVVVKNSELGVTRSFVAQVSSGKTATFKVNLKRAN